jgi:hypothetical protein
MLVRIQLLTFVKAVAAHRLNLSSLVLDLRLVLLVPEEL